jgi:hypothetical protein
MERFLDPYFYVSRHKLVSHLDFDVTVWRARSQDEESRQRIAHVRVRWGDRRPSPRDLANMAHEEGRYDDAIFNYLNDQPGTTALERLDSWLRQPYTGLPAMEKPDEDPVPADTTAHIFTRSEQDGFFNAEELVSEVDPAQPPTALAIREVCGSAPGVSETRANANPASDENAPSPTGTDNVKRKKQKSKGPSADAALVAAKLRDRFFVLLADGSPQFYDQRTPTWQGTERVLVTFREIGDGQFIAKPSLDEDHVLSADDQFIVSYRIAIAGHQPSQALAGSTTPRSRARTELATRSTADLQLHSEALDLQKRSTILRQLVASTGHIPATGKTAVGSDTEPTFTLPPSNPQQHRVHFFGTVEKIRGLDHSYVFLKCEFVLPLAGFQLDSDVNRKCGVSTRHEIVSQTACASRFIDIDEIHMTMHQFNLPFELHGIMDVVTPVTPRMVVSAWSADGDGRQSLLGYGLITLSPVPGRRHCTVEMWKPSLHGRETLRSLFVGGSVSLVDAEDAAVPYKRRMDNLLAVADEVDVRSQQASLATNSRAGLLSESAGTLTINWMCAVQQRHTTQGAMARSRFPR